MSATVAVFVGLSVHLGAVGIEPPAPEKTPELMQAIQALHARQKHHGYRAMSWQQLAQFDLAVRELEEAHRLYQAGLILAKDLPEAQRPATLLQAFDLAREIELVRASQSAHQVALKQFNLPPGTLGFVQVREYKDVQPPLWAVAYSVADESLTTDVMAANVDNYVAGAVPPSRSFVAAYEADGQTMKKAHEVAVPRGFVPYYFEDRSLGFLLVFLSGGVAQAHPSRGGMLLEKGRLVELPDGPCRGPVVFPRQGGNRLDALAMDPLITVIWAMQKTDGVVVIARHESTLWHMGERVAFHKDNITRIERPGANGSWDKFFDAAEGRNITADQAKLLARYYGLRADLDRDGFLRTDLGDPKSVEFDSAKAQWVLGFQRGSPYIAGVSRTIILDAKGALVSFQQSVVPR